MSDHRGMWAALAVALITIGVGGFVSAQVGATFVRHHGSLDGVERACAFVTGIGAGLLLILLSVYYRLWRVRRRISTITRDGTVLFRIASWLREDDPLGIEILGIQFEDWRNEANDWLATHDPIAQVHFDNESGLPLLNGVLGTTGPLYIQNHIDIRLQRLAEITGAR